MPVRQLGPLGKKVVKKKNESAGLRAGGDKGLGRSRDKYLVRRYLVRRGDRGLVRSGEGLFCPLLLYSST